MIGPARRLAVPAPRRDQRRLGWRTVSGRGARYLALAACSFAVLLPVYWALITSFKPASSLSASSPQWLPFGPTLKNYEYVLSYTQILRQIGNSLIISGICCVLTLAVAVHAAYASTRFQFRGKNAALFLLLSAVMIPGVVTLLPQYFIAARLGLIDTKTVLILVFSAWQLPLAVWVLRAYFLRVPPELDEAAMLDGCSRLSAFYRIALPLSVPGIAAAGVVVFVWCWNEFIISATLTETPKSQPLTAGLYVFTTDVGINWGGLAAATMMALVPALLIFLVLQRRFVQGLTGGATY